MRTSPSSTPSSTPRKRLRPRHGLLQLDLGLIARPVVEIGRREPAAGRCRARTPRACSGPAAGRAHRAPATGARDLRALLDRDGAVRPLGHDLHASCRSRPEWSPAPGESPGPRAPARPRQQRCAANAGLANKARVGCALAHRSPPCSETSVLGGAQPTAQNKKSGPGGPTLRVEMIMSSRM